MQYYASIITDPKAKDYQRVVLVGRVNVSKNSVVTERWDIQKREWVDDPTIFGRATGLEDGLDFHKIDQAVADGFIAGKTISLNTFEGHAGRPGQRGGSLPRSAGGASTSIRNPGEARGIVDKIIAAGKDQNGELGFSYQPFNDTYPTTGVMNSNFPERNENIAVDDFTEERLIEYVNKNADLLADPSNYLGGWVQYGRIDLDISRRFETLDDALKSAEENYQAGVFSLDEFKTYYVRDEFDPSSPKFSQKALDEFRAGKSVH